MYYIVAEFKPGLCSSHNILWRAMALAFTIQDAEEKHGDRVARVYITDAPHESLEDPSE